MAGFELVKQNRFSKVCQRNKEKRPAEIFFLICESFYIKNVKNFNKVFQNDLVKFSQLNSFFIFLCLMKLLVKTSRSMQI